MKTKELLRYHESAVSILEAIQSEEQVLKGLNEGLKGFGATHFPETKRAYQKGIIKSDMRLKRLTRQYYQLHKSKMHEND